MDVKENVEVPLLGRVLRQWHTLTWHHLEVLRTERRKKRRSLRERECPTDPHRPNSQDHRNGLFLQFPSRWTALTCQNGWEQRLTCSRNCVTLPKEQSRQTLGAESNLSCQGPFWKNTWGPLLHILMRRLGNGGKRVTDTGVLRPLQGFHTY